MPDYSKGKIYKLWSPSTGLTYIGSTCQSLAMRLAGHVRSKKRYDSDKSSNYLTSFEILDYNDYRIDLVEEYPCENRMQLNKREGEIITQIDCINKNIAGRTQKQYYESNKDEIREWHKHYYEANKEKIKQYYEVNKDKIRERQKQYRERTRCSKLIECPLCGRTSSTAKMKQHQTTKICIKNR